MEPFHQPKTDNFVAHLCSAAGGLLLYVGRQKGLSPLCSPGPVNTPSIGVQPCIIALECPAFGVAALTPLETAMAASIGGEKRHPPPFLVHSQECVLLGHWDGIILLLYGVQYHTCVSVGRSTVTFSSQVGSSQAEESTRSGFLCPKGHFGVLHSLFH